MGFVLGWVNTTDCAEENMWMCSMVETTWWKFPQKGGFYCSYSCDGSDSPCSSMPAAVQVLGLWSAFLPRSSSFTWNPETSFKWKPVPEKCKFCPRVLRSGTLTNWSTTGKWLNRWALCHLDEKCNAAALSPPALHVSFSSSSPESPAFFWWGPFGVIAVLTVVPESNLPDWR